MGPIGLVHYLVVGALVFGIGVAVVVTRRNAVAVLMGVELILNAAALNFVAFSRFVSHDTTGQVIAVFVITAAAAEAAVALAITLHIFGQFSSINVDEVDNLKE